MVHLAFEGPVGHSALGVGGAASALRADSGAGRGRGGEKLVAQLLVGTDDGDVNMLMASPLVSAAVADRAARQQTGGEETAGVRQRS